MEWLKEEGFGGIMVWSIDMDDFSGRCGSGKYPLLNVLNSELKDYKVALEYDGPYESFGPRGAYTTKDRKSLDQLMLSIGKILISNVCFSSQRGDLRRRGRPHQLPSG